ncbi:MAG: hypothetical protein IKL54_02765 [Bacteroidaceae bacterium]|nr:hypothetical protein [Bacteroidaceae bacterium]
MPLSKQTQESLRNAINDMAKKYITAETAMVTDFHIYVNGDNGTLTIYDDDDNSLARVHIKEWENVHDEKLFEKVLRGELAKMQEEGIFESINIVKPYSFVLVDEDKETIVDLLYIDDDTLILSEDLLKGFDEEMNDFLKHLLED